MKHPKIFDDRNKWVAANIRNHSNNFPSLKFLKNHMHRELKKHKFGPETDANRKPPLPNLTRKSTR